MIPYGRQDITQADIDAVVKVLQSDFLTQGPRVPLFEHGVAAKIGAKHALAVNSATSALHIACMALDIGQGDWLWTTPITFVASANCGLYCGAQVDFVDIDPQTYNLCPKALEAKLINAERQGNLPKVIVAVHLCGQSCDMEAIHKIAQSYGIKVIEDASHAIGGKYQGEYIGNGRFSDITVFSFHPVKIITTAEGGMALTNDDQLAEKMSLHRSHGVTRDQNLMSHEPDGPWYYQQVELGYNYRMNELQAALGISQLERLDSCVAKRNQLAARYDDLLLGSGWILPKQNDNQISARHLYVVRLAERYAYFRTRVFEFLRKQGIGVNIHYIPVHTQPYYRNRGVEYVDLTAAEKYYATALTIPLHPTLSFEEQDFIVEALKNALAEVTEGKCVL